MSSITLPNAYRAIVRSVASQFLPCFLNELSIAHLVTRDSDTALAQIGDRFNVPGGTIELTRHIESTFFIPDLPLALTQSAVLNDSFRAAALSLATYMERDLLGLASQFTLNKAAGTPGARITDKTIAAVETAIFCAHIPCSTPKYLAVGSQENSDIRLMHQFRVRPPGEGEIMNFRVVRSQYIRPDHSGLTTNLAFTPEAIGLVTRGTVIEPEQTGCSVEHDGFSLNLTMQLKEDGRAAQFSASILYGYGILRQQCGVQVLS